MNTTQAGGSEYGRRIRRAERLSAMHPFASEFLDFYRQVASIQAELRASFTASRDAKLSQKFADGSRTLLNLTLLLPHHRGFLSVIEQHAPPALREAARQMSLLAPDSWVANWNAYWEHAGKFDQQIGAFAQFLPRAFLQPYAELLAEDQVMPPAVTTSHVCPICGARPLMGVLRPEGDGGKRFLLCCFCCQEWEYRRILCPTCGEEAEEKLPVYVAEQFPQVRVEACETCKSYLQTVDLTKDGNAVPLVDDLAAIPLTLWAHEHGYSRLQANLLGT
jgi:formate dehydrogenase accessory protein FdhE